MTTRDEIAAFSLRIEEIIWEKDVSYTDAIIIYCTESGLEIELAAKLISGPMKAKIRQEAEALNFLPRSNTNRLPIT